jgi:hypothetical protein
MVTSSRNPFPIERGSVCATWTDPSSRILPRDVSLPACAMWAGTSSRPFLPSSSSHPLTHPEDDLSVGGIDSPRDPHRAPRPAHASYPAISAAPYVPRLAPRLTSHDLPAPRVPRLAPCPASRDLRRALHPATSPRLASRDLRHALRLAPRLASHDLHFPRRPTTCVTPYTRCSLYPTLSPTPLPPLTLHNT